MVVTRGPKPSGVDELPQVTLKNKATRPLSERFSILMRERERYEEEAQRRELARRSLDDERASARDEAIMARRGFAPEPVAKFFDPTITRAERRAAATVPNSNHARFPPSAAAGVPPAHAYASGAALRMDGVGGMGGVGRTLRGAGVPPHAMGLRGAVPVAAAPRAVATVGGARGVVSPVAARAPYQPERRSVLERVGLPPGGQATERRQSVLERVGPRAGSGVGVKAMTARGRARGTVVLSARLGARLGSAPNAGSAPPVLTRAAASSGALRGARATSRGAAVRGRGRGAAVATVTRGGASSRGRAASTAGRGRGRGRGGASGGATSRDDLDKELEKFMQPLRLGEKSVTWDEEEVKRKSEEYRRNSK